MKKKIMRVESKEYMFWVSVENRNNVQIVDLENQLKFCYAIKDMVKTKLRTTKRWGVDIYGK